MTITQESLDQLHRRLDEVLGPDEARTLMELLAQARERHHLPVTPRREEALTPTAAAAPSPRIRMESDADARLPDSIDKRLDREVARFMWIFGPLLALALTLLVALNHLLG